MLKARRSLLAGIAAGLWMAHGFPAALAADETWSGTPQEAFLTSPIVRKYQCVTCHTITDQGGTVGPVLNLVGLRRSEDWLRRWLADPNAVKPGTKMPKFPFLEGELEATAGYLSRMQRALSTAEILAANPSPVDAGRALFADYDCYACHRIGDRGRFVGPDLTWVGIRKPPAWEKLWLRDPPGFKPDTFMPDFDLAPAAVEALTAFLHTLQGQDNDAGRQWENRISFIINTDARFRGEMVWKRLGCWGCHGENGKGGVENPNALPGHETVPDLRDVRDGYDLRAFFGKITTGSKTPPADPGAEILPYDCPAYPPPALKRQGLEDLYAYVSSLAPPKLRWIVK